MLFWVFQIGEQPPLTEEFRPQRISKLCNALTTRGHNVVRWASAFDHSRKTFIADQDAEVQLDDRLTLVLAKSKGYNKNISLRRRIDHNFVSKGLTRLAKLKQKPDLILVCTPPYELADEVVRLASDWNVPVVVDVRDEWPESFVQRLPGGLQPLGRIALWNDFRKLRRALSNATALTSMVRDLLYWGLKEGNRKETGLDRVFYLGGNDIPAPKGTTRKAIKNVVSQIRGRPTFLFAGTFGYATPPEHVVDVARRLNEIGYDDIQFVLAGDGPNFERVNRSTRDIKNVLLPGWLSEPELALIANHAYAGLITSSQNRALFPNKAFTYFSMGLPVIAATRGEAKILIDSDRLGITCRPNDIESLCSAVRKFVDNPVMTAELKQNVKSVFQKKFASHLIYKDFAQHLEHLAQRSQSS